jgi:hypothetical protein
MAFAKGDKPPDFDPLLPVIYTGWSGYRVQEFTYSQAVDIDKCGFYTRETRIVGRAPVLDAAGFKFGDAIETSVRNFYMQGVDPTDTFNVEWGKWKDVNMLYRAREDDWNNLLQIGRAGLRIFMQARDTLFPFTNIEFNLHLLKKDWYKGTPLGYIADAIAHCPDEDILVDIKTAGAEYPDPEKKEELRGWPMLDPQLRTGMLVTGIRKVAFLVFVKLKTPRWQWIEGVITDELLHDQDLWLRAQYDKYERQEFFRRSGMRFPNEVCRICDLLPVCLNRPDSEISKTLRVKTKRETDTQFEALAGLE